MQQLAWLVIEDGICHVLLGTSLLQVACLVFIIDWFVVAAFYHEWLCGRFGIDVLLHWVDLLQELFCNCTIGSVMALHLVACKLMMHYDMVSCFVGYMH